MRKILISLFLTVFACVFGLSLEYCFFNSENCPFQLTSDTLEPSSKPAPIIGAVQAGDCTKRVVSEILVDDCNVEPSIHPLSFKISYLSRANGQGDFKHFGDGSVLHSGDHLKRRNRNEGQKRASY